MHDGVSSDTTQRPRSHDLEGRRLHYKASPA